MQIFKQNKLMNNEANKANYSYLPLIVIGVTVLIIPLFITNPAIMHLFILVFWFAYLSSCWNIVGGFSGQLSFAHAVFTALGAYTSSVFFIYYGISPWLGMLIGGLFAVGVSILIGLPTFRLRGAYFALATIAVGSTFQTLLTMVDKIGNVRLWGAQGLILPIKGDSWSAFQFRSKIPYYYIMLIMLVGIIFISCLIKESKMGYYLRAIAQDEDASKALGVNPAKYKLLAFIISGFFAALGGTFYAQLQLYIEPSDIASLQLAIQLILISIIGGKGSLTGPLIGTLIYVPLSELTRMYLSGSPIAGIDMVVLGATVVIVILFQPMGVRVFLNKWISNIFFKQREIEILS